jgi:branched-subunit amino acid ABC-type transport system permease component
MGEVGLSLGFGLITASILALGAVGVTLQFGVTRYINFAYGSYLALAAYIAWEVNTSLRLNFWLAVPISAIFLALFAVVVDRALLRPFVRRRLRPVYLLIVTLGLWMFLSNAIVVIWGSSTRQFDIGNESPLSLGPFLMTASQLGVIGLAVVALVGVHLLLTRTKLGKAMRAMADDVDLAQASGIDTDRVVTVTWLLTGLLAGLSGCMLALDLSSFLPSFGDDFLFVIFSAVVLGGIGQPYGTMLGALIIGVVTQMAVLVLPAAYNGDVAFAVLIVVVMVRPQGLIPAKGRM